MNKVSLRSKESSSKAHNIPVLSIQDRVARGLREPEVPSEELLSEEVAAVG